MQYVDYRVGLVFLCSRRLPEDDMPVPKHVGSLTLVMNCILLIAFAGWCIYYKNMHGTSNMKLV